MKAQRPSATAAVIAGATIIAASDKRLAPLVPDGAVELSRACLLASPRDRWMSGVAGSRFGAWMFGASERLMVRHIGAHYARRKHRIEAEWRRAHAGGFTQLAVLGAGYDSLGARMAALHPELKVVEVDHPATQAVKQRAVKALGAAHPPHFVSAELMEEGSVGRGLGPVIDAGRRTMLVAEGLLMYFPRARVVSLLREVGEIGAPEVRIAFTWMERDGRGRAGFRPQGPLLNAWLGLMGEPFRWGATQADLERVVEEAGLRLEAVVRSRELISGMYGRLEGENLCVASRG